MIDLFGMEKIVTFKFVFCIVPEKNPNCFVFVLVETKKNS